MVHSFCCERISFVIFVLSLFSFGTKGINHRLYDYVTCGSVVKLVNQAHGGRLHSHEVSYGSGSGQQSVTAIDSSDDANSYWRVRGPTAGGAGLACQRGEPIRCGAFVRLTHLATKKNLHSHLYSSPITHQQEVSAFGDANGEGDRGDDWQVVCAAASPSSAAPTPDASLTAGLWRRADPLRLRHAVTERFLHVSGERYGHPIAGQAEVSAVPVASVSGSYWVAGEGIFIKSGSGEFAAGNSRLGGSVRGSAAMEPPGMFVHDSGEF